MVANDATIAGKGKAIMHAKSTRLTGKEDAQITPKTELRLN